MNVTAASSLHVNREKWVNHPENQKTFFENVRNKFSLPVVIKASSQGSSIGVSILRDWNFENFQSQVNRSFFIQSVHANEWNGMDKEHKRIFVQQLCDIYEGIGTPLLASLNNNEIRLDHPAEVFSLLEKHFSENKTSITFSSLHTESAVLVEEFIRGKEFSCIVVEGEHGEAIALPPTGIIKTEDIFNYRAKYLPGISRKVTPIDLPEKQIQDIIDACESLYTTLQFDVYARIDGMITDEGKIYLNDPNTT